MTMNAHEFVKAIEGKTGLLIRTCCATGRVEEEHHPARHFPTVKLFPPFLAANRLASEWHAES